MQSLLSRAYGSMRMDEMCKHCLGNADKFLQRFRCPLCKKSVKDYKEAGLEGEAAEMQYLKATWQKCKVYKQVTTGIARLDLVLTVLWGPPHKDGWRDYKKTKREVVHSPYIVLRLVRV